MRRSPFHTEIRSTLSSSGDVRLLHADSGAGHKELRAPARVLHVDCLPCTLYLHIGDEPVGPLQEFAVIDSLVSHTLSRHPLQKCGQVPEASQLCVYPPFQLRARPCQVRHHDHMAAGTQGGLKAVWGRPPQPDIPPAGIPPDGRRTRTRPDKAFPSPP